MRHLAGTESLALPGLQAMAARFDTQEPIGDIEPLGRGLINDTFSVATRTRGYVLQRINARVFPDPERIMANLLVFRTLLAEHDGAGPRIPRLVLTRDGAAFTRDAAGDLWRMMELIPNAITLTRIENAGQAREVGRLLGGFHRAAATLPIERFGVSLPGFHATPAYLERLQRVFRDLERSPADPAIVMLMEFVDRHRWLAASLDDAQRTGRIRSRIAHGDPKLDNILFSTNRADALALIDLDTIQPGLIQHDLGDCLRSCCNRNGEGAPDPAATRFDLSVCEAILSGYAAATETLLDAEDINCLYTAIALMPFELGMRFLTDHLEGNRYFRVDHPDLNLLKAQIQFALVADIECKETKIRGMIREAFRR